MQDLIAELQETADEFLCSNAAQFDPTRWTTPATRELRRKAFGELSVYLAASDTARLEPLRELVYTSSNEPAVYEAFRREPRQLVPLAYPALLTAAAGALSPPAERAMTAAFDSPAAWRGEAKPNRQLHLWHCYRAAGRTPPVTAEELLTHSSLRFDPGSIRATLEDVYDLTHVLLCYHDFGLKRSAFPDGTTEYDLTTTLRGLTLRLLAAGNYDAALEVTLVGVLEAALPRGFVGFVLREAVEAARENGYVPGPGLGATAPTGFDTGAFEPSDGEEHEWATHHHTNLTAGLLAASLSGRVERLPEVGLDHRRRAGELLTLGETLDALANYDLRGAGETLTRLHESPVVATYHGVTREACAFLESQSHDDGVGYWPDERHLFVNDGGDPEAFHDRFVAPTAAACDEALSGLDDRLDWGRSERTD